MPWKRFLRKFVLVCRPPSEKLSLRTGAGWRALFELFFAPRPYDVLENKHYHSYRWFFPRKIVGGDLVLVQISLAWFCHEENAQKSAKTRKNAQKPRSSISWCLGRNQWKPPKTPRIFSPLSTPGKPLEKLRKIAATHTHTRYTEEFPWIEKTKENQNTKEQKIRVLHRRKE